MVLAELSLALEPAWPWSIPKIGLPAMLTLALLLAGLTVWTYLGVRKATWPRLLTVLLLRLLALVLVFCMMMRPSFAVAELEGVETSKLLVVFDASESMNVADVAGKPTRWEQVKGLWASRNVQRRLERLASEQKIEVVKYLAAEDLRPDEPDAAATGKRTDIGAWLHQLWQQHGSAKHLRGIVLFSDGGDNGTRYSTQEKARAWRGLCPLHTFGAGDPKNAKFDKDIALTRLRVDPPAVAVKDPFAIQAVMQAPGFEKIPVEVSVWLEDVRTKQTQQMVVKEPPQIVIKQVKDQKINLTCFAPEKEGEYKLTVKIVPHPEESNKENNEISTYLQVIKKNIHVLWVDRPRVYDSTLALRYLRSDKRFTVREAEPPTAYKLEDPRPDVIVVGDISAQRFSLGNPKVFDKIKELVQDQRTGLLMLGGPETFANGGWDNEKTWMDLMPVTFLKIPKDGKQTIKQVSVLPTLKGLQRPFLQLLPDPKKNESLWTKQFEPLDELTPLGELTPGSTELATAGKGKLVMAERKPGEGIVIVFAGDTTYKSWLTPETADSYPRFWKQLILYLAQQKDSSNQLVIDLDKRRLSAGTPDILGFSAELRGKTGIDLTNTAQFKARVILPNKQEVYLPPLAREGLKQRGTFQGAKEPGEYQLVVSATAKDVDGGEIQAEATARFLAEVEAVEKLRPAADHELLSKIAVAAEGRFHPAEEQALLQYLDELQSQVNGESRLKTTHWPDWKRLPSSEHMRDQLAGVWNSFALMSLVLFVGLLGGEWLLRRWWGLV